ncbi:hypothetical protein ACQKP0_06885 [Heyndrickxia sp. NPDC080065]|uniref:hypothetical protein n=1 Tax=Heyndrickxia sp. NPDC080065 TaxID=3390568 RepID=UPI003D004E5A
MNLNSLSELRNIRIALVIITVILALSLCGRNESDHVYYNDDQDYYPKFSYSNMVDLGNGDFGVLNGDSYSSGNATIVIYHYDKKTNEITVKKEQALNELQ